MTTPDDGSTLVSGLFAQGMQYMRDVAAATAGMTDEERTEWCAEMDAWRDAVTTPRPAQP